MNEWHSRHGAARMVQTPAVNTATGRGGFAQFKAWLDPVSLLAVQVVSPTDNFTVQGTGQAMLQISADQVHGLACSGSFSAASRDRHTDSQLLMHLLHDHPPGLGQPRRK